MEHYVYIIQSEADKRYYVGSSQDLWLQLERHSAGWTRLTNGRGPWKLVYVEEYEAKALALRRELGPAFSFKNAPYGSRALSLLVGKVV